MNVPRYRHPMFALQYDLSEEAEHLGDVSWYRERTEGLNGSLVEIGAGTGRVTAPLLVAGRRVVATDIGHAMLARLPRRLGPTLTSCRRVTCDCRALPFPGASFDAALSAYNVWGCLEEPGDLRRSLEELRRILRTASPLWFDVAIQRSRDFRGPKRFSWQAWTATDGTRIRRRTTLHPRPEREWLVITYEYEWWDPAGTRHAESVDFGLNTWPLDRYLDAARGAGFWVDHVDTKFFDGPSGPEPMWAFVSTTRGSDP